MSTHTFPWVFPYAEDLTVGSEERRKRTGRLALRPVLPIELSGPHGSGKTLALVDSGSEHTLAAPWLARATGHEPGEYPKELTIGLGGSDRKIWFTDATLTIPAPPGSEQEPYTWTAEVGFIHRWEPPWAILLGQIGLFDQFTVTMNRWARALALEPLEAWDERYPDVADIDPSVEFYFPYP